MRPNTILCVSVCVCFTERSCVFATVSRKRKNSRLLDRSVRRMWQSRVAAAFSRWCEFTQQQRVKRRATLHMANRFPASFFTRWQKFTRYHKQLREEREAYEDAEAAQQSLHDWKRREKRKVRAEAYRRIYKKQLKKWHFDAMADCFYAWRRWCNDRVRQKLRDEREETKRLKEQEKEEAETATATIATADAPGKMSSLLSTLTGGLLGRKESILTASVNDALPAPGSPKSSIVLEEDDLIADSSEEDKRPGTDRSRRQSSPRRSPEKKQHGSPVRRPGRSPERRAPIISSEDEDRWPPLDDDAFRSKSLRRRRMTSSRRRQQQQQRRRSYDYDSHRTRRRDSGSGRSPSSPARAAVRVQNGPARLNNNPLTQSRLESEMRVVQQGRSRSRSGGSPKSGRRRPSGEGDVTSSDLDEETRLFKEAEREVEEELKAANDTLFKVETDKGSSFRRSSPRSPPSVARRTSPRSPKERRRKSPSPTARHMSKGGEVSPRTLPMPPGQRHHYSDSELDSELDPVEVDRARREISAEVERDAERELRRTEQELQQRRSPSPRRNDHGHGDQCALARLKSQHSFARPCLILRHTLKNDTANNIYDTRFESQIRRYGISLWRCGSRLPRSDGSSTPRIMARLALLVVERVVSACPERVDMMPVSVARCATGQEARTEHTVAPVLSAALSPFLSRLPARFRLASVQVAVLERTTW